MFFQFIITIFINIKLFYKKMSVIKRKYDDICYERLEYKTDDTKWVETVLYIKDKIKKSSLKNGDGFGFDNQRLSSK